MWKKYSKIENIGFWFILIFISLMLVDYFFFSS